MRAHWLTDLSIQDDYVITGDALHHLAHVVRVEKGEDLLLLNGKGLFVETTIEAVSKKDLRLKKTNSYTKDQSYNFDLALGMPKREALELTLKQATELGFRNIYLIKSDYSQMRFPESDRTEKLLVSALEQSNAPFLPKVLNCEWTEIPWTEYEEAILLDSQTKAPVLRDLKKSGRKLLIVGPEGGFSPEEIKFLHAKDEIRVLNLPTPILRTPTAVAAGAGIMIESLLK